MDKMLDFIDEKIVQPKNESLSFKFDMFSIITSHSISYMFDHGLLWFDMF